MKTKKDFLLFIIFDKIDAVINMERDLIARALMNVLDVAHFYDYEKLKNDDLYEQLKAIIHSLTDNQEIAEKGYAVLNKNKAIIDKIVSNTNSYEEFQLLCEDLRTFKRQNGLLSH